MGLKTAKVDAPAGASLPHVPLEVPKLEVVPTPEAPRSEVGAVEPPPIKPPPVKIPPVEKVVTATTTELSSGANPSKVGQAVTYTATVSPTAATGVVEFNDGGTPIAGCGAQAVGTDGATCTVAAYESTGPRSITATYTGDLDHLTSTSVALTQNVEAAPAVEPAAPFRFFSPTSFWNKSLPAGAPLDPASATVVAALNDLELAEQAEKHGPAINTTSWSVPIYTVPAGQPEVRVTLINHVVPALQSAWSAVPLPSNAQPSAGWDKHLVVWQPSTDRMWEFWSLENTGEGWRALWGGAMEAVTANVGVYGPEAWTGATTSWGASASSLPIAGGLITLEDLEKGIVNHALALSVPNTREGAYASPARRTDGGAKALSSLPEGAHLRLDPALDLASLKLPRLTRIMAEAAQRYGIFIRDTASNLAFYAEDPSRLGVNPYAGSSGYFEGKSATKLLASFPWSHLQLLKMDLHTTS